ncbi:hypothetical protein OG905_00890 [Streptomyces sp. NBC_00322]|uniref:hypothetical protein n=1 Tax=Streptomyces sp. NBC_00322 TaxID=2975712 RepID=UPI002E2AE44F|nr:hypothetical protein [Streptomyces sp. NBC_00322]
MTQTMATVVALVAVAAAVPLLFRARRLVTRLRRERDAAVREAARLAAEHEALTEEHQHLVGTRLPALATQYQQAHREVLHRLAEAVIAERNRVDEAAQAVTRGVTTVILSLSHQLRIKIDEMRHRYDDPNLPDLAQDLLGLEHLNEQNLHHIQGTQVLCGAWPGLLHADSHLEDVVVGAQHRIRDYRRVRVTSQLEAPVAVVARAVEPIAITVAELLANAVHHTHGTPGVDVGFHQAESGARIVIEDAGVGMHADEVEFADRLLSAQQPILLSELGDPPHTGFAKISRLARQYEFSVSIDKPSPHAASGLSCPSLRIC